MAGIAVRRVLLVAVIGCIAAAVIPGPVLAGTIYGDKAGWINNVRQKLLSGQFDQIDAFMWFNHDNTASDGIDWRLSTADGSAQAFYADWGRIQLGAYIEGFPPSTGAINDYETLTDHRQSRVGWYESLSSAFPTTTVQAVFGRHAGSGFDTTPFIVWQLYAPNLGDDVVTGPSRLQDIINGGFNVRIDEWIAGAQAMAAAYPGRRIEISIGHEMNGDWYSWGFLNSYNGNTPEKFADAFRHIVDRFDAAGVTNVDWVWCPNASWQDDFSASFPGIEYVDRMGLNGFNWGRRPRPSDPDLWAWDDWRDFEYIFGAWKDGEFNNYQRLTQLSEVPIIIGEFSSNTPEPATAGLLLLGAAMLARPRRSGPGRC